MSQNIKHINEVLKKVNFELSLQLTKDQKEMESLGAENIQLKDMQQWTTQIIAEANKILESIPEFRSWSSGGGCDSDYDSVTNDNHSIIEQKIEQLKKILSGKPT